jgi:hypothetical protein
MRDKAGKLKTFLLRFNRSDADGNIAHVVKALDDGGLVLAIH